MESYLIPVRNLGTTTLLTSSPLTVTTWISTAPSGTKLWGIREAREGHTPDGAVLRAETRAQLRVWIKLSATVFKAILADAAHRLGVTIVSAFVPGAVHRKVGQRTPGVKSDG